MGFSLESLKGRNIIVHDAEIMYLVGSKHPHAERLITWEDHHLMGISVICTFEYADMEYHVYMKDNFHVFIEKMNRAELITGFNVINFDHRLYRGEGLPLKPESELPTYDILVESRKGLGWSEGDAFPKGCRLDNHLKGTFGEKFMKTADGAMAPQMWQEGRIGELVSYCLADVHRERTLFEYICEHGFVITDTHGAKPVRHPFVDDAIKALAKEELKPNFAPGSDEWIREVFTYHAPTTEQQACYQRIRENAKAFAKVLYDNTPRCADQTMAIRKLRETVQTANAAIALNGLV